MTKRNQVSPNQPALFDWPPKQAISLNIDQYQYAVWDALAGASLNTAAAFRSFSTAFSSYDERVWWDDNWTRLEMHSISEPRTSFYWRGDSTS